MQHNLSKLLLRSLFAGFFLSTLFFSALYVGALMGSDWAMNMLLKLTLPDFNMFAVLLPDGIESLMPFFASAWLQIGLMLFLLITGITTFIRK